MAKTDVFRQSLNELFEKINMDTSDRFSISSSKPFKSHYAGYHMRHMRIKALQLHFDKT